MNFTRSILGDWRLNIPDGTYYSGTYLENMWRDAFSIYKDDNPSKVLIIGSGAGCSSYIARTIWKNAEIDAVDYDSEIIKAGKEIYNFKKSNIRFIVDDAISFMATTNKKYDFVLVDIFVKNKPSTLLKSDEFATSLQHILSPNASLVMNVAIGEPDNELIIFLKNKFPSLDIYMFKVNSLLLTKTRPIPDDYYDISQNKLSARTLGRRGYTIIGEQKSYAIVQSILGFALITTKYTDIEPDILTIKKAGFHHGIILWTPWKLRFVPAGWYKSFTSSHAKGNGFSVVTEDYKTKWSETARRDLKKFGNSSVVIEEGSEDYFLNGVKKSASGRSVRWVSRELVKNMEGEKITFWITKKDGKILGGLATVDYDNISYNLASFITPEGTDLSVGTGLIDKWYQYAIADNIKYLNFGYIKEQGEPKSWEGFSNFKKKFIDREIVLPNAYIKIF